MDKRKFAIVLALLLSPSAILAQEMRGVGHYRDASGPMGSGECANYSDWYTLTTPPLSPGRTIANFSFHLTGDRGCGAWAECELMVDAPTRKSVRFRMQGHSEYCGVFNAIGHPNNGTAKSEMVFEYDVN